MNKVCFISSSNGLGHARRLLHIAHTWHLYGFEVKLVVTDKQRSLLFDERLELFGEESPEIFISQPAIGLQGPEYENSSFGFNSISEDVLLLLRSCEIVISDNSLWPFKFRKDTILLAHFLWVDYYRILVRQNIKISSRYREFLAVEDRLVKNISNFAAIDPFRAFELKQRQPFISLGLPYYNLYVPSRDLNHKTILVTVGRTDTYKLKIDEIKQKYPESRVLIGQTYNISRLNALPDLVIGRAGLGTIRDCAEYGINFKPLDTTDPELISNSEILKVLNRHEAPDEADNQIMKVDKSILRDFPNPTDFLANLKK